MSADFLNTTHKVKRTRSIASIQSIQSNSTENNSISNCENDSSISGLSFEPGPGDQPHYPFGFGDAQSMYQESQRNMAEVEDIYRNNEPNASNHEKEEKQLELHGRSLTLMQDSGQPSLRLAPGAIGEVTATNLSSGLQSILGFAGSSIDNNNNNISKGSSIMKNPDPESITREFSKQFSKLSLLVVDDSQIERKIAKTMLSGDIGGELWLVQTAENGETALQVCESNHNRVDVIIIDQNMESSGGRLLGHQVVANLRQNMGLSDVIIIGCSGFGDSVKDTFLSAGCDDVWAKPLPSKIQAQAIIQRLREERIHRGKVDSQAEGMLSGIGDSLKFDSCRRNSSKKRRKGSIPGLYSRGLVSENLQALTQLIDVASFVRQVQPEWSHVDRLGSSMRRTEVTLHYLQASRPRQQYNNINYEDHHRTSNRQRNENMRIANGRDKIHNFERFSEVDEDEAEGMRGIVIYVGGNNDGFELISELSFSEAGDGEAMNGAPRERCQSMEEEKKIDDECDNYEDSDNDEDEHEDDGGGSGMIDMQIRIDPLRHIDPTDCIFRERYSNEFIALTEPSTFISSEMIARNTSGASHVMRNSSGDSYTSYGSELKGNEAMDGIYGACGAIASDGQGNNPWIPSAVHYHA